MRASQSLEATPPTNSGYQATSQEAGMELGGTTTNIPWALSPAPYQIGPEPAAGLASTSSRQEGEEEEVVWNLPSSPSLLFPPPPVTLLLSHLIVDSGLGGTSAQGLRMSKFLGYSWSPDSDHPSILANSERPVAGNAREITARPISPKITPHVPLPSPHGFGHFGHPRPREAASPTVELGAPRCFWASRKPAPLPLLTSRDPRKPASVNPGVKLASSSLLFLHLPLCLLWEGNRTPNC